MSLTATFQYGADLALLGPYAARFRALAPDAGTEAWLAENARAPHGVVRTWLVEQLSRFVTVYDAHGLTGSYPMHLLSTEQWCSLVGKERGRLLDVGAGGGYVTSEAAPLFREVVCTETSKPLARKLSQRGFRVHVVDLAREALPEPGGFDVVACLNVLDRTRAPNTLLRNIAALLAADGHLVLALPLPVRPHVHVAGATISPDERLPGRGRYFEEAVVELCEGLFEANGLEIERIARVPYLSRGDQGAPMYVLDDAVFVLKRQLA